MAKQDKSGQDSAGRAGAAPAGGPRGDDQWRSSLGDLLSFYYPMHYRIGIDVETVMGQGRISRKQGTILWLIHSRGDKDGWLRRKLIEERLSAWFEISNSSVSNLLRELTRPPLELVKQIENPTSGREKLVCLTPKGRAFLDESIRQSIDYLGRHLEHIDQTQLDRGIQFFKLAFQPLSSDAPPAPEDAE